MNVDGHSEFQIDHFIVGKGNWTPYAKLRQVRREIESRERGVAELQIDLEEKYLDLNEAADDTPRGQLAARRIKLAIHSLKRSIDTNKRELERFRELESKLKTEVSGDDAALDQEAWLSRLRVMLALDLLCNGRPSTSLVTLLMSTPSDFRHAAIEETLQVVSQIQNGNVQQAIEQACKLIEG